MKAKIVIVGGGVMGLSIAMYAARRNDPLREPVVLLEKDQLGAGSSGRSGAVVRQFYNSPVLAGMARDSLRTYSNFASEKSRSVGFLRTGVLTLATSREAPDLARLDETIETMVSVGAEAQRVEAEEIRALVQGIEIDDRTVGAYEPLAGTVDPQLALEALAALARNYGAVIKSGCAVSEVLLEGGRVVGVETCEGRVECETVVITAGPWSPGILKGIGIELPLSVMRTEQHFIQSPGSREDVGEDAITIGSDGMDLLATNWMLGGAVAGDPARAGVDEIGRRGETVPHAAHPVLLDQELGFYTRNEPRRNRTRVGRLDYEGEEILSSPEELREGSGAEFSRWTRERIEARIPIYADMEDLGTEAGLYTVTPDAQAIVGSVPDKEGLLIVTGFSGHGFKLAPSIGEGVAQMIAGEPVSAFDADFFSPERFTRDSAGSSGMGAFGL